jgi:hypothetical protein
VRVCDVGKEGEVINKKILKKQKPSPEGFCFLRALHLLRQGNPYLQSRPCSGNRRRCRDLGYHPPLVKVQLNINPVIQHIIYRRGYDHFLLARRRQGHRLIKAAVGCSHITQAEIEPEIDIIVKLLAGL